LTLLPIRLYKIVFVCHYISEECGSTYTDTVKQQLYALRACNFVLFTHAFSSYGISQHSLAMTNASHQRTMQCDTLNILQTLITIAFNTVYV